MSANQALRSQFSSGVSSALEDADSASKNLLSSIDRKLSNFCTLYRRRICLNSVVGDDNSLLSKNTSADSLQLDHNACEKLDSMIVPCCEQLRELNTGHLDKVAEIREHAGKCLSEEYTVRTLNHIDCAINQLLIINGMIIMILVCNRLMSHHARHQRRGCSTFPALVLLKNSEHQLLRSY